jgi:ADP-heptose:LPS heptosyltransferase
MLSLDDVSSVLLIPSWPIGDLLLNLPIVQTLRSRKPSLRIGLAVGPRNAALVAGNPAIDVLYNLHSLSLREGVREIRRARRDRWDVILSTAGYFRPVRNAVLSRMIAGRAPTATMTARKLKRYRNLYSFCYLRPAEPRPNEIREHFLLLVEHLFGIVATEEERKLHFEIRPEAQQAVDAELVKLREEHRAKRIVHINLEAKAVGREWGIANSKMLAEELCREFPDVLVLFTATPNFVEAFPEALQPSVSRARYFPTPGIHELAALVARSELVITPDTSVMHLAVAAEKQIVAFYDLPNEWLPYPLGTRETKTRILYSGADTEVRRIPVDDAFNAAMQLMHHVQTWEIQLQEVQIS